MNTLNNVALALFILPYFLFSALAGQVADKYDRAMLVRRIKLAEVAIMACAAAGFFFSSVYFLLAVLFLMGLQSTFFGPIKYSIIPQHLGPGSWCPATPWWRWAPSWPFCWGRFPGAAENGRRRSADRLGGGGGPGGAGLSGGPGHSGGAGGGPGTRLEWNLWKETWRIVGYAREVKSVWISVLGISWFWFLGAAYTTQLKVYVDDYLLGTDGLYALLLGTFSVGIGFGSWLCEKLSGHRVELGLVPLGSIGLSLFGIDLFFSYEGLPKGVEMSIAAFTAEPSGWRVLVDLAGIGVFGGFYIVPLFAFIQQRSDPRHLARIIAANNILNALLMVASAAAGIVLVGLLDLTVPQFFLVLALLNVLVAAYIYTVVPEFLIRLLVWMLTNVLYRIKTRGLDNIPDEGPCLLVCNHVSYVDALLLGGAVRRPVRFVMFKPIYDLPLMNYIFRTGKTIPIDGRERNPVVYENAFRRIREELEDGQVVCIFPEGRLTGDGELGEFKSGVEKL